MLKTTKINDTVSPEEKEEQIKKTNENIVQLIRNAEKCYRGNGKLPKKSFRESFFEEVKSHLA